MDDSQDNRHQANDSLAIFQREVAEKYQRYGDRFLSLPYRDLPKAGALLKRFSAYCAEQLKADGSAAEIVPDFFRNIAGIDEAGSQISYLFWFLQFIERQVVLFDALEDAAYPQLHKADAPGTLNDWLATAKDSVASVVAHYSIRFVLTAHPTQFYPTQIIGILGDLTAAIEKNDDAAIDELLLQMAETSFVNAQQPSPYDEAVFLCQYLDKIFYPTISKEQALLDSRFGFLPAAFECGFWPGGDRDGNPNVTTGITEAVLKTLNQLILKRYLDEIAELKHRLTFKNAWYPLLQIEMRLSATLDQTVQTKVPAYPSAEEFKTDLKELKSIVDDQCGGLYVDKINHLISAVTCFGFYYASLDLRQDSLVHSQLVHAIIDQSDPQCQYLEQDDLKKVAILKDYLNRPIPKKIPSFAEDSLEADTLTLFKSIPSLQRIVGERGLHRYIISHTQGAHHVLEVMLLSYWCGLSLEAPLLDIVPLFESIEDLSRAEMIMQDLYEDEHYQRYLQARNKTQTVMLGYSDGTKDGGYVTANWAIYCAKATMMALSTQKGIQCLFFDGRGGPPARGGGNTHLFYRALASSIPQKALQLTIQGQTISTNFGTLAAAEYNMGQLYTAGLSHLDQPPTPMPEDDQALLKKLSDLSSEKYQTLVHHPEFFSYLDHLTPMNYFGDLNIASRPPRRNKKGPLSLDNLRAITFVSAWSQMKQNVPAYYGFGSAIQALIESGHQKDLESLYQNNLFFHTLVQNAMQSLLKNYFPLTRYLSEDPRYGEFWRLLSEEAQCTEKGLLAITGQSHLLAGESVIRASIQLRESIVLPLQVIQQYALVQSRRTDLSDAEHKTFKKIIEKTLPTNLNASRNSA